MVSEREEERNEEEAEEPGRGEGGGFRLLGGCGEPQCHLVGGIETTGGGFFLAGKREGSAQLRSDFNAGRNSSRTTREINTASHQRRRGSSASAEHLGSLFVRHFAGSHYVLLSA